MFPSSPLIYILVLSYTLKTPILTTMALYSVPPILQCRVYIVWVPSFPKLLKLFIGLTGFRVRSSGCFWGYSFGFRV